MAQFPISIEEANREIKALISDKGLDVITSKMIRKHLEAKFNCNFEEHKSNLDAQIETCIVEMENEGKMDATKPKEVKIEPKEEIIEKEVKKEKTPATDSSDSEDGLSKIEIKNDVIINSNSNANNKTKSAQKRKVNIENEKADEDEVDMASAIKRRRSNAVVSKKKEKKAKTKEKSTKGKGNRKSMFTNVCALSPELSVLLGRRYSPRSDVVKQMWNYFRTHNLQDPKNKQFYYLDEPLKKVFGKNAKRIKAFGMMSKLNRHVKDIRDLDEATRQIAEAEIAEMEANEGESETANESTSGQQMDEDSSDEVEEREEEESNEGKELLELKIEAEESNISYSSQQSFTKSEECDEAQPSTSTAYQQTEESQNGGQQDSSDTSNSSESETSSDDSGGNDF